jgi:hypothetical protein
MTISSHWGLELSIALRLYLESDLVDQMLTLEEWMNTVIFESGNQDLSPCHKDLPRNSSLGNLLRVHSLWLLRGIQFLVAASSLGRSSHDSWDGGCTLADVAPSSNSCRTTTRAPPSMHQFRGPLAGSAFWADAGDIANCSRSSGIWHRTTYVYKIYVYIAGVPSWKRTNHVQLASFSNRL